MLVLDESPSMAAMDNPALNRFDIARKVIKEFMEKRENDAIGLVTFAAAAALRAPPTLNHSYLVSLIDGIQIMSLGDGTAMGMGIALAILHLQESTAENQAIILITDGMQNMGEVLPETASEIATSLGIRIYAIGIGKEGTSDFRLVNPETNEIYIGTIEDSFDGKFLENIATLTGGRYFTAGNANALSEAFESIGILEKNSESFRYTVVNTHYHIFYALCGILFIFVELVVRRILLEEVL
jgi:Ca-activated chloride channel family protein